MKVLRNSLLILAMVFAAGCQDDHAKNREEAMQRWDTAHVNLTMNMARQQFEGGQIDKAHLTVQKALDKTPDYVPGYLLLGRIYLEKNSPALARDCFVQCLALEPESAEAHYYMGSLYERWKDLKQAHGYYLKAWQYQPEQSSYLLALVETEVSLGQQETALQRLVEHVQLGHQNASIYMVAGELFTQMGQRTRTIEMYREAKKLEPGDRMIKETLAFALHRAGDAEAALPLFQSLVIMAEENGLPKGQAHVSQAYLMALGDCYLELRQFLQAKRTFETMRELEPLNPVGWARLAQVEIRRGDYPQAKFAAEQALSLKKDYPDAMMVLGFVAWKAGKMGKVEFCMNQVLLKSPKNGVAYCLLGQALANLGQVKDAEGCYRQALKINPQDKLAKRLYKKLRGQEVDAS
jgi:tetratricopeptide (TPR) repeat protein